MILIGCHLQFSPVFVRLSVCLSLCRHEVSWQPGQTFVLPPPPQLKFRLTIMFDSLRLWEYGWRSCECDKPNDCTAANVECLCSEWHLSQFGHFNKMTTLIDLSICTTLANIIVLSWIFKTLRLKWTLAKCRSGECPFCPHLTATENMSARITCVFHLICGSGLGWIMHHSRVAEIVKLIRNTFCLYQLVVSDATLWQPSGFA